MVEINLNVPPLTSPSRIHTKKIYWHACTLIRSSQHLHICIVLYMSFGMSQHQNRTDDDSV